MLMRMLRQMRQSLERTRKGFGLALVWGACTVNANALPPTNNPTPEIDAGSAASAVALLVGGLLLTTEFSRRQKNPATN